MRLIRMSANDGYFSFVAQQGGRPGGDGTRGTIDGSLMLQYLLAMLQGPGARGGRGMDLFEGLMPGGVGGGGERGGARERGDERGGGGVVHIGQDEGVVGVVQGFEAESEGVEWGGRHGWYCSSGGYGCAGDWSGCQPCDERGGSLARWYAFVSCLYGRRDCST